MMEPPRGSGVRLRVDAMVEPMRGYEVMIRAGALAELPARIGAIAPAAAYAVIVPDDIGPTYGERVTAALRGAGLRTELLSFAAGEAQKSRATWSALTDRLLELEFGRDSCIVAVGGGVTGDLAGFVAATYMRGISFVQVPTTLLAMIDASVGGKTGVDTPAGKNLVGAFHAPRLVIIDPLALRTLPPAELRSGIAEAIKHGAILDVAYFDWIERSATELLALDPTALELLIARSVELKAAIVSEDPHEQRRRNILNFGHTVGHALERHADYALPHGFAVAAGMVAEARLGELVGVTEEGTSDALMRALARFALPVAVDAVPDALLATMRIDKKARRAEPRFVLLRRIGECAADEHGAWTHAVSPDALKTALHRGVAEPGLV